MYVNFKGSEAFITDIYRCRQWIKRVKLKKYCYFGLEYLRWYMHIVMEAFYQIGCLSTSLHPSLLHILIFFTKLYHLYSVKWRIPEYASFNKPPVIKLCTYFVSLWVYLSNKILYILWHLAKRIKIPKTNPMLYQYIKNMCRVSKFSPGLNGQIIFVFIRVYLGKVWHEIVHNFLPVKKFCTQRMKFPPLKSRFNGP